MQRFARNKLLNEGFSASVSAPGVDHLRPDLAILGPTGHEAPVERIEPGGAVTGTDDGVDVLCRGNVVVLAERFGHHLGGQHRVEVRSDPIGAPGGDESSTQCRAGYVSVTRRCVDAHEPVECQNDRMTDLIERCADLPRRSFAAGDVVVEQGTPFGSIVILVDGSVSIERDGVTLAMLDTPGAVLGEMSTVLGPPVDSHGSRPVGLHGVAGRRWCGVPARTTRRAPRGGQGAGDTARQPDRPSHRRETAVRGDSGDTSECSTTCSAR